MGLAYEEYCDEMYEREFCMSDIDFGCVDCKEKAKELEECYDGYHLFRIELEKIVNIMSDHVSGNTQDLTKISINIFRLCDEAGFNYVSKFPTLQVI